MDFVLYGKDARLSHLAVRLLRAGHRVLSWEGSPTPYAPAISSLLELGCAVRLVLPQTAPKSLIRTCLCTLPVGSRVFGGRFPAEEEDLSLLLCRRALRWEDLSANDTYCRENAVYTAEGALHKLLECTPVSLSEMRLVLLGSGRVAEGVLELLRPLVHSIVICARNDKKRQVLKKAGFVTCRLPLPENERYRLKDAHALINTVPQTEIVSRAILSSLKKGTPLLELASGRDNIDLSAAAEYAHPVHFLPALPGIIAPKSAADALFYAITKKG